MDRGGLGWRSFLLRKRDQTAHRGFAVVTLAASAKPSSRNGVIAKGVS
jgi:hypothetical protein